MINPETVKKDFPIFEEHPSLSYLDNAATTQTPSAVLNSMDEYYRKHRANTRRGQYALALQSENLYENARGNIAEFIGAQKDEVIFTSGATGAMNMLVLMLEHSGYFAEGDEIVTTEMEHHSVLLPLQELAKRRGLAIRFIEVTKDFRLDYAQAENLINEKTKLFAFTAVSNVTGTINDVLRLSRLAKSAGAISVVDAAQAVGHIPLDVKNLGCDFLFFSGHKMFGPTGIGALYGRKEFLETLPPGFFGGGMVDEVSRDGAQWALPPWKFEAGTQNIAGAIGLGSAVEYIKKLGIGNIANYLHELSSYALKELAKIQGISLFCEENSDNNAGVVSFALSGIHPHDVAEILSRDDIAVRAGHHCALPLLRAMNVPALTRASFSVYNSKEDIDRLCKGIEKAKKIFH